MPSDPGLLFWGRFLITVLVFAIVLFIISLSSWFSHGRLNFSKNLSISSRLSILLAYSYFSYGHLYFCVCCNLSFLISNFVDFSSLFFFLMVWLVVCQFCLSSQRTSFLGFINLCYCFLHFFFHLFLL